MGCNQSKQACGCGNHIKDRDGKEYCLPSCQTEVSIEEIKRELFKIETRQRLAQKKGYLKARGGNKNDTASLKVYKDQAPMKPIENFLEIDTVEAIFDRGITVEVNRKEVHSVLKNEEQSSVCNEAVTNKGKMEALELCSDVPPKPDGKVSLLLEDKEKDTTVINEEDVKIFVEKIISNAMSAVSAERVMPPAGKEEGNTTMINVAPKDVASVKAVETFVNDVLSRALDVVVNDDIKSAVSENNFPLMTEEEKVVSLALKNFVDDVNDKVQDILANDAPHMEDDVITVKDAPLMTEEEESVSIIDLEDPVKIFLDGVIDKALNILANDATTPKDDVIAVKDDLPLITEEEESVSIIDKEDPVKIFLDDVISRVLDARHLEPEGEETTKENVMVKNEDDILSMTKEEEIACMADMDVIKNFVNEVIDNAADNAAKCSVATEIEDSLPEPDSKDLPVLVHLEDVKTGFDSRGLAPKSVKAVETFVNDVLSRVLDAVANDDIESSVSENNFLLMTEEEDVVNDKVQDILANDAPHMEDDVITVKDDLPLITEEEESVSIIDLEDPVKIFLDDVISRVLDARHLEPEGEETTKGNVMVKNEDDIPSMTKEEEIACMADMDVIKNFVNEVIDNAADNAAKCSVATEIEDSLPEPDSKDLQVLVHLEDVKTGFDCCGVAPKNGESVKAVETSVNDVLFRALDVVANDDIESTVSENNFLLMTEKEDVVNDKVQDILANDAPHMEDDVITVKYDLPLITEEEESVSIIDREDPVKIFLDDVISRVLDARHLEPEEEETTKGNVMVKNEDDILSMTKEEEIACMADMDVIKNFVNEDIDNAADNAAKCSVATEVEDSLPEPDSKDLPVLVHLEDVKTGFDSRGVAPKDVESVKAVETFVNDVLFRASDAVANDDIESTVSENNFLLMTEEEDVVNDKVQDILANDAPHMEDDVITVKDDLPLITEEEESISIIDKEDPVKIFLDDVISRVLDARHLEPEGEETTKGNVMVKNEDDIPSMTKEEEIAYMADMDVIKNFVNEVIDNAADNAAKCSVATEVEDSLPEPDSKDLPVLVHLEDVKTGFDCCGVAPKNGESVKAVETFVNDVLSRALDAVANDDIESSVSENNFLLMTEEEDVVNDKVQDILANDAPHMEDDVITVKDDLPLITEEEESVSIIDKEDPVKIFLDDVISRVLDARHLEPEEEETTKGNVMVKNEDDIPSMTKEEEIACMADMNVIKNFVNEVIDNAADNAAKCSVATEVEDSLPEPDSKDLPVLVHLEDVKTGFDCCGVAPKDVESVKAVETFVNDVLFRALDVIANDDIESAVSGGPQAKNFKDEDVQSLEETQVQKDTHTVEDVPEFVAVSLESGEVGRDCVVSRDPQAKNFKDAQSLDETQVQEGMKTEDPVQELMTVSWGNIQVSMESVVSREPPAKNIGEEPQIVRDVGENHKNMTNQRFVFGDRRTGEAMSVEKMKDAVAVEQSYAVAVSGKAVSMATAVSKGIDNVITDDSCKLLTTMASLTTPFTDFAENERNVLGPNAQTITTAKKENTDELEQGQQIFEMVDEKRDSKQNDGKISRVTDLEKTELVSRRDQEYPVYDGDLVPVFFKEPRGECIDLTKRDNSTSLRPKEVLFLLTTVLTPDEILDTAVEVLDNYQDDLEDEQRNNIATNRAKDHDFRKAEDSVNAALDKKEDEPLLVSDKEGQSSTDEGDADDESIPILFNETGAESIDSEISQRHKNALSILTTVMSQGDIIDITAELFKYYPDDVEEGQINLNEISTEENSSSIDHVAVQNNEVNDNRNVESTLGIAIESKSETADTDACDNVIPVFFGGSGEERDLTNRDKLMPPTLFTDMQINPSKKEIIKSKVRTSAMNAGILHNQSSSIQQPHLLMENLSGQHDSILENITSEDNTSEDECNAVPRSYSSTLQLHRVMEDTLVISDCPKEERNDTEQINTKQAKREVMNDERNTSECNAHAVPRSSSNNLQHPENEYHAKENNVKSVCAKQATREMMSAEDNTSEDDDNAIPRSHSNIQQLYHLMEDDFVAYKYHEEENNITKPVYTKKAKRIMLSAEDSTSEDEDNSVPRSLSNSQQLNHLMQDTMVAHQQQQAKREMMSAEDNTSEDDDNAIPRSYSNTIQLHHLMGDDFVTNDYHKKENDITKPVYTKQAKREMMSPEKSNSDDENANAFPRSKILASNGLDSPSRTESGTSRVISKEKLTSINQETSEKVYKVKELEASINPPPFLIPTPSRNVSWIGRMASRLSLGLSKQNLTSAKNPAQAVTVGNHHVFQLRSGEALTAKVSRWFTGKDRFTNSRINTKYKLQDHSPDVNTVQSLRDNNETLYEMGQTQQRNEVDRHRAEYDYKDVRLAVKEFNKVRAILSLDGTVSTDLVTKFLMARDFDVDGAISLYKNYMGLRETYCITRLNPLYDPLKSELYSGTFTVLDARDQHGAAIAVFTAKLHSPKTSHDVVMCNIYLQLDEAIKSRETQEKGIVLLYDFSNITYKTCDVQLCSKILELFKLAYPLRLRKILLVSPPFWFETEMRLFSSVFRDTKLRQNLHIVTHSSLKQHLPLSSIPRGLGGECHVNHLRLIEDCISSHKERAGMNNEDQNESTKYSYGGHDDIDTYVAPCSSKRTDIKRKVNEEGEEEEETFFHIDLGEGLLHYTNCIQKNMNHQRAEEKDGDEEEPFPIDLGDPTALSIFRKINS